MSESPEGTDSAGDANDDGQLTIRIPNPKMYMARQSQWKGRRGKPRCDHCRINNLKCDRVLPTCNHCSWVNGRECRYTPLPTPAHRGIPRCDRCRLKNLKCDRNLPICNHCSEDVNDVDCNYTPKKRHKVPSDHGAIKDRQMAPYGAKTASFLVSDMQSMDDQTILTHASAADSGEGHSFYGQNVASSSRCYHDDDSPNPYDNEESDPGSSSRPTKPIYDHPSRTSHSTNRISFISHSFPSDQGMVITKSLVESWYHPSFAPLPQTVLQRINSVNSVEMPNRSSFELELAKFLNHLPPELRETATFTPDIYADISHSLSNGDSSRIPDRLRMWMTYHHVRLGSAKFHLLLIPRDAFFHMDTSEEEKLRKEYTARVDHYSMLQDNALAHEHATKESRNVDTHGTEWAGTFERIPVQNQIYDILVYAHRAHGSSSSMLIEARHIGMATITWPMVELFIRLCPLCNLRNKAGSTLGVKADPVFTGYEAEGLAR
ncbi:hypothetical protein BJ138DRAFT_356025 [Hygrophoropsis aurantiaca]|uniref:Uncharacterized protein n=1 Tax=Hygrophoropsis aurantiaca TaxID=72124 RepID=A0ACB8A5R6_9AGAM|nr:hypothetical protein BJ138DRAFT_356025 [Hygrophoropsis aurantiaca]